MRKSYIAAVAVSAAFAAFTTMTSQPAQAQTVAQVQTPASVQAPAQAQSTVTVKAGKPIYGADGAKLGSIYKVAKNGAPQVIVGGKLITVPLASVSISGERIVTTLTRKEIMSRR